MFKMLFASAATLVVVAPPATAADVTLKTFTTISSDGTTKLNNVIFVTSPATGSFGVFAYTISAYKWAEAIGGLTYSPTEWSQILVGGGAEQDVNPFRGYTGLWLGNAQLSFLAEAELGGSGFWYQSIGTWKANDWLSVGYTARRFEGVGPRLEVSIPKSPFTVWSSAYVFDLESRKLLPGGVAGVTARF